MKAANGRYSTSSRAASRSLLANLALLIAALGSTSAHALAGPSTIEIRDGTTIHTMGSRISSTNLSALWNPTGVSPGTTADFAGMGLQLVRFPGGVPCQWYDWTTPLATGWSNITSAKTAAFARAGGAVLIFEANMANDSKSRSSADESNVHTATKKDDGSIQVMVINKTAEVQEVALSFQNDRPAGKAVQVYSLQGANGKIQDTDVIYNGQISPRPASAALPPPQTGLATAHCRFDAQPYALVLLSFAP